MQWWMLAPLFAKFNDGTVNHYVLQSKHILLYLPLILPDHPLNPVAPPKYGGSGTVFMVRIHEEHHGFTETPHWRRGFAAKQQNSHEHRVAYNSEIEIFKRFTQRHVHNYIITLLVSYKQFEKFHLIIYRAEGASLNSEKQFNRCPKSFTKMYYGWLSNV
ncbi:hypothetical protein P154DRAFT_568494 [Amniculicola lignicola CBS 123094]|uniref:Protein kinase domain-containing protein n=1 Tax=Amniculicola lignicola CBS 123094 TaxID=1392246 RepID=A0A6A5X3Z5_9PLEO|nr:hypothetical protein P154DRAFT_568494 [Amniculicola lignicola CBS 123094]